MFLLRMVFWIFVMAFVFSGGELGRSTDGPPTAASSPPEVTAGRVMAAADKLTTLCVDRPGLCVFAGEMGGLALDFASYFTGRLHEWLESHETAALAPSAAMPPAPAAQRAPAPKPQ